MNETTIDMLLVLGTWLSLAIIFTLLWMLAGHRLGGRRHASPLNESRVPGDAEQPGAPGDAAERGGVLLRMCPTAGPPRHLD